MEKEMIATGIVNGEDQRTIAKTVGVSQPAISQAIKRDTELQNLIEAGFKDLTGMLPRAIRNAKKLIEEYDVDISASSVSMTRELQKKEHGFRLTEKLLESVGLLPSHTQAQYIQNVLVQNTNQYISPIVERAIHAASIEIQADSEDTD